MSFYRSLAGSYFNGTEYEIWADIRLVGNTERKWVDFEASFSMLLWAKEMLKSFKKQCSFYTKKLQDISFIYIKKSFWKKMG